MKKKISYEGWTKEEIKEYETLKKDPYVRAYRNHKQALYVLRWMKKKGQELERRYQEQNKGGKKKCQVSL